MAEAQGIRVATAVPTWLASLLAGDQEARERLRGWGSYRGACTHRSSHRIKLSDFAPSLTQYPFLLDATRISDGKVVMLKCISKTLHPHEASISALLSSPPLRLDPTNHCVPVYDVLHPPGHEDFVIIVMAFCRLFDNPRFDTVGEAVEFFRQVFEVSTSRAARMYD